MRARSTNLILAITPSDFLGAGRDREYEVYIKYELACMSREATRFLALEPVSFSTTAAYSFVFAVWGYDQFTYLYENYLLVLSTATKIA